RLRPSSTCRPRLSLPPLSSLNDPAPIFDREYPMSDTQHYPYATYLNAYYEPLQLVDVPALVTACTDRWYNQTLCRVNDSVVRLGVLQGEYHWHKHDNEDEFFYVVEGRFLIDLADRTVELGPRHG